MTYFSWPWNLSLLPLHFHHPKILEIGILFWIGFLIWSLFRTPSSPTLIFSLSGSLLKNGGIFDLRSRLIHLPKWLKFISLLFMLIALARPQTSSSWTEKSVDGVDIVIALDVSDSMLIEDMIPTNRIESAKETLKNFVQGRTSDRIGIVIFAGESFTLVPMTLDYELITSRVNSVAPAHQANIKDGTAIGVALANAAGRLKDSVAKSRVIIFLTDGENNTGTIDPLTGLELAKGLGLKIYSIGIGQDGMTKIPIYQKDILGRMIKSYQPFESHINEDLLKKMAQDTGGKFFRASQENSLKGIFSEIDQLEKTKIEAKKYNRYTEHFQTFLCIGILAYLVAWVLSITWLRRNP